MSDIVDRIRDAASLRGDLAPLALQAADEIERLREDSEAAHEMLANISKIAGKGVGESVPEAVERLRARLAVAENALDEIADESGCPHAWTAIEAQSQIDVIADQPSAAPDLPALKKAVFRAERDLAGFDDAEDEFRRLRNADKETAP